MCFASLTLIAHAIWACSEGTWLVKRPDEDTEAAKVSLKTAAESIGGALNKHTTPPRTEFDARSVSD